MARRKQKDIEDVKIGHNSNLNDDERRLLAGFASEIERIQAEQKVLAHDLSEIYAAAGEKGFDTKAIRHVIKMRAMNADKRRELEAAIDAYQLALPFGEAIGAPAS